MSRGAKHITLALCLIGCLAPAALAQDLFLTNAHLVDPAAQEVRQGSLLIRDGVIVGAPDQAPADFSGETVDLEGKWVLPGLNDLHTHSFGNQGPGNAFDMVGMLGQLVGIVGEKSYDGGLRLNLVTPRRIDILAAKH